MLKYLRFVFLFNCMPKDTLPKDSSAAVLLCERAVKCQVANENELNGCIACTNCFFTHNGGEAQYRGFISQNLDATCQDLTNLANSVGVIDCYKSIERANATEFICQKIN